MPDALGWPFLVAAGRHRDYSTLLAPDFLVADLDFGFLDELAPASDRPTVTVVRTRAGRSLAVAYATRGVTSADVDPAGVSGPLTDEVGRPLRLIYGFVTGQADVALAEEDLAAAFDVALAVYRRFLRDEDAISVALGQSFPLRSRLATPASAAPPAPTRAARPSRRPVAVAVGAGAAVLAAMAIVVTVAANRPHPSPCPTPSPAAVMPTPSPACPPSPSLLPR